MYNPELYEKDDMKIICITNAMFLNALNFILGHEFAHAKYRLYAGTIEDEIKADFHAAHFLTSGAVDPDDFGNRAVAGLLGLGAMMLLSWNLQSTTHPDSDKRIIDYIHNIEINDDNNEL